MIDLMSTELTDALMRDEWEIRRLAYLYASGADNNDGEKYASVFTDDAVVVSPKATIAGRESLAKIPAMLRSMYVKTMHTVLNQTMAIDGDHAEGETYCIAYHLSAPQDGRSMRYDMYIKYQDKLRREGGSWKFYDRHLVVDWGQTVEVQTDN
jgi:uncharacterized protein (TIGR02246 family)